MALTAATPEDVDEHVLEGSPCGEDALRAELTPARLGSLLGRALDDVVYVRGHLAPGTDGEGAQLAVHLELGHYGAVDPPVGGRASAVVLEVNLGGIGHVLL